MLTLEKALEGIKIPASIKKQISLIEVDFWGYDGKKHRGQLLVNSELKDEIRNIFKELYQVKFPIEKIIPVCVYSWSDDLSMNDNNTSCFNYRKVKNSEHLSMHAYGRALDINPKNNPFIHNNRKEPVNGSYSPKSTGTITANSKVVKIFKKYGWKWGGDWIHSKDYQHFYKNKTI